MGSIAVIAGKEKLVCGEAIGEQAPGSLAWARETGQEVLSRKEWRQPLYMVFEEEKAMKKRPCINANCVHGPLILAAHQAKIWPTKKTLVQTCIVHKMGSKILGSIIINTKKIT